LSKIDGFKNLTFKKKFTKIPFDQKRRTLVNKTYRVSLSETQATMLQKSIKTKNLSTKEFINMQILLLASQGKKDAIIAETTGRSISTVERTRKHFVQGGTDTSLAPAKNQRKGRPPKLNAAAKEFIVQLIQKSPPVGYARWTGALIRKTLINQGVVKSISLSTIYRCLKSRKIRLNQRKTWCISKFDEKFVAQAKIVIETYHRPYNSDNPVVCFDEKSYELKENVRKPLPPRPGRALREDNEWRRHGTVNIFMFCEPKRGMRHVKVTKRRTKLDFARCMKQLTDVFYPKASKITVVLDNLNTHTKKAIIDTYGPEIGQQIADRLEFVHTPVHGSWLNMAEIELSVLSSQSLKRRIPCKIMLNKEIRAWNKDRNKSRTPINWKYTIEQLNELFEKIRLKQSEASTRQN
jgi:transposase